MESDMSQAAIMDRSPHRVNPYQYIFSKNLQNISSVAGLNMVFCECNATSAIMNTWLRSVVSGAVFVQAVCKTHGKKRCFVG